MDLTVSHFLNAEERHLHFAKVLYQGYGDAVGWKNYQGLPMPATWEDLTDTVRKGWIGAAEAQYKETDRLWREAIYRSLKKEVIEKSVAEDLAGDEKNDTT